MLRKKAAFDEIDIDVSEINIPENLQRTKVDQAKIQGLADSINKVGLINKIVVIKVKGGFELVAGYRRYLAFIHLKKETIPARIAPNKAQFIEQITLDENLEREEINIVDEAFWLARVKENSKLTLEDLARKIGKSAAFVSGRLALLEWSEDILAHLIEGSLSLSNARELQKCKDPEELKRLCELVAANGATSEVVKYWVNSANVAYDQRGTQEDSGGGEEVDPPQYKPNIQLCEICTGETNYMESKLIRMCPRCLDVARVNLKPD